MHEIHGGCCLFPQPCYDIIMKYTIIFEVSWDYDTLRYDDVFYLFFQKQKIAQCYIPIGYTSLL